MIQPPAGTDPANRLTGWATPSDGAGPISSEGWWPQPADATPRQMLSALNPLQHLPVVGMIYRAATGEDIPPALRMIGAGLVGGPFGAVGSLLGSLVEELFRMGPDTSRPAVPAGMQVTGAEAGVQPVTPGTAPPGAYTTLATVQPAFLASPVMYADAGPDAGTQQRGAQAYKVAETEWQRCCRLEKGLPA